MADVSAAEFKALLARVEQLEKKNQELETESRYQKDRREILDVMALYTRSVDRYDWPRIWNDVYHEDAILDYRENAKTPKEFTDFLAPMIASQWSTTMHTILNHNCDLQGDVAHTETYAIVFHLTNDNKHVLMFGARYIDRFERRNGKWKIAVRRIAAEWRANADVFPLMGGHWDPKRDKTDPSYVRPMNASPEALKVMADKKAGAKA